MLANLNTYFYAFLTSVSYVSGHQFEDEQFYSAPIFVMYFNLFKRQTFSSRKNQHGLIVSKIPYKKSFVENQ